MRPGDQETLSGGPVEPVQPRPTDHTLYVDAPSRIGVYRLDVLLGRGGMGEVWRAHDTNLERDVALKLMRRELNENQEAVKRFMREARAVARLNHPNIVQIYTFGEINGAMYFVMELVEGGTVTEEIRAKGSLQPEDAVSIALQSIEGLDYALNRGIIHRDIKPSNLMLRPDGLVKIADFGLAKMRAAESQMTAAGSTMGSPNYMSPEQARGEEADHRSDMYSLGITLYQMLTGELPFTADSPLSVLLKQIQEPLPEPQYLQSVLDGRLLQIIKRMTAKHADRRYGDYRELAQELERAVPTARARMMKSSGLSATSSYPTPGPESLPEPDGAVQTANPTFRPGAPQAAAGPPPIPAKASAVASQPPSPGIVAASTGGASSIATYHRDASPAANSADIVGADPQPSAPSQWRLALSVMAAVVIVVGAVIAQFVVRPPAPGVQAGDRLAVGATPAVAKSSPEATAATTPAATPTAAPSPEPTTSPTPAPPAPTPILLIVQAPPQPAPATPTATPEARATVTPAATPIQMVTSIRNGIIAPDLPTGTAVPARLVPSGAAASLPAQAQVQVVRTVSDANGESGYIVRHQGQEYVVAVANIRIETRTLTVDGREVGGASGRPAPPRTEPLVVQVGGPNDTASNVPVYRDSTGLYELKTVPRGTEVVVVETLRDSYKVSLPEGRTAYVLRRSTSPRGSLPVPQD